jgi:hypothetical protein
MRVTGRWTQRHVFTVHQFRENEISRNFVNLCEIAYVRENGKRHFRFNLSDTRRIRRT